MRIFKKIITLVLMGPALSASSYAQDSLPDKIYVYKNFYYVYPIDLLNYNLQMGYEREFGKKGHSIMLVGGLFVSETTEFSERGGTGELHVRLSLLNIQKPNGFRFKLYLSPFLKYDYIDYRLNIRDSCIGYDLWGSCNQYQYVPTAFILQSYLGGAVAGARVVLAERIAFGLYIGGGARMSERTPSDNKSSIDNSSSDNDINPLFEVFYKPGGKGIIPLIGIQLGIGFGGRGQPASKKSSKQSYM